MKSISCPANKSHMSKINIIQIGIGPLGIKMYQMAQSRDSETIVGAVDVNPNVIGKDLGVLAGMEPSGIIVRGKISEVLASVEADIALLTTVSDMNRITPHIMELLTHGLPVISTCEELSYPWNEEPELALKLDVAAKEADVAILGTGVNPGFLMDSLPSVLSGVCSHVQKVEVSRFQDAKFRRIPFQQKIGAGLSPDAFEAKRRTGTLRHVGLTESMQFIAYQMGWKLDKTEDILAPVIADSEIVTDAMTIPAGYASGVRQIGLGFVGDEEKIRLEFQAAVGEKESYDEVRISGTPDIISRIKGGVNGDVATCAITLNAAHSVLAAQPGLQTMATVPMVSCHA